MASIVASVIAPPAGAQAVCTPSAQNPTVRFETTLGDVDVLLCRADVSATVDSFLQYVNDGAYTDRGFLHRSVQSSIFVVQGGGAYLDDDDVMHLVEVRDVPLPLEAVLPNVRGTIAMARGNEPDSARSQWFFNVQDNPGLDAGPNVDGYAVFGEVVAGIGVVDAMAAQTIWMLNPGFLSEVPLIDYPGSGPVVDDLIFVTDVRVVPEPGLGVQAGAALLVVAGLARRRARRR
jgi:peptidyl-prolyl cis-trans isomerase A (cyclophilin A)